MDILFPSVMKTTVRKLHLKNVILFNKYPITNETITSTSNTNQFQPGDRIHYLVAFPKKLYKRTLLVQVFKVGGDKDERGGHEIIWGKRVKLKTQQHNFYTDYIVLNQTGVFVGNGFIHSVFCAE